MVTLFAYPFTVRAAEDTPTQGPIQVEFNYQLTPTKQDTILQNQARLRIDGEPDTQSNSVCTRVGSGSGDCVSTGPSGPLTDAAQDLYNAIAACVPDGRDLKGETMTKNASCIKTKLQAKYNEQLAQQVTDRIVRSATLYTCTQCVGFVEASLILTSTPLNSWPGGSSFWNAPPPGYQRVIVGGPESGDIFTYGNDPSPGHVGIVKNVKSFNRFIAIDANAENKKGFDMGKYGSCDASDSHEIVFTPGDNSGSQARFLRKSNKSGGGAQL